MASFVKFETFIQALANKEIDWFGTTDTFRAAIHSDAPVAASDAALSDLTEITGTGYTAGGEDIQNDSTRTGGTVTMTAVDVTWTASAADWVAGRYVALYDDTHATNQLFGDYDYGANFTVGNGESFTLDFGASLATLA